MKFTQPKSNSTRTINKFAFLPIKVKYSSDVPTEIRWLTMVKIEQIYLSNPQDYNITKCDMFGGLWVNKKFID